MIIKLNKCYVIITNMFALLILLSLLTTEIRSQQINEYSKFDFVDTPKCFNVTGTNKTHNATLYMILNGASIFTWDINTNQRNYTRDENVMVYLANGYICMSPSSNSISSNLTLVLKNYTTVYSRLEKQIQASQTKIIFPKNGDEYFEGEIVNLVVQSGYSDNTDMNILFTFAKAVSDVKVDKGGMYRFINYRLHYVSFPVETNIHVSIGNHKVTTKIRILPLPRIHIPIKIYLDSSLDPIIRCEGVFNSEALNTSYNANMEDIWIRDDQYTWKLHKALLTSTLKDPFVRYNVTCMHSVHRNNNTYNAVGFRIITVYKTCTGECDHIYGTELYVLPYIGIVFAVLIMLAVIGFCTGMCLCRTSR